MVVKITLKLLKDYCYITESILDGICAVYLQYSNVPFTESLHHVVIEQDTQGILWLYFACTSSKTNYLKQCVSSKKSLKTSNLYNACKRCNI